MSLSVELQPRDGGYVKLGTQQDGGYGILPASIEYGGDLNEYGCLDASFRLKLNPRWPRNIIEHYTPVVIRDGGGKPVWSGRIIAAPTTFAQDAEVTVQCQGHGQHLKDDFTARQWVTSDLSQWRDIRSYPDCPLATYTTSWQVQVDGNAIVISVPSGVSATSGTSGAVVFDAGEGQTIETIGLTYSGGTAANLALNVSGHNTLFTSAENDAMDPAPILAGPTTDGYTFSTPCRYILINLTAGAAITGGDTAWLKVTSAIVATDSAYMTGNASALVASTAIGEVLDEVAPLISNDRSRITTTATVLPQFPGSIGYKDGHELFTIANAIHGYRARLTPDPTPVMEFDPMPTTPSFMVGAGQYTLAEPAAFDGRNVYSRIISEYEDAAGILNVATTTEPTGGGTWTPVAEQITNPTFATDASGWDRGVITRSAVTFNTGPGGGELAATAFDWARFNGRLHKTYRVAVMARGGAGGTATFIRGVADASGSGSLYDAAEESFAVTTSFQLFTFDFTLGDEGITVADLESGILPTIGFLAPAGTTLFVDDVAVLERTDSVVLRRGFRRTALKPPGMRATSAFALALAQLELDNAQYPPFKGTIVITGRIRTPGGGTISVRDLPSRTGEMLLIENLSDPNTGALGRQGIIYAAKYTEATDSCEVTIDSAASFLQGLQVLKARVAAGVR